MFLVSVVPYVCAYKYGLVNLDDYVYIPFRAELQRPLEWATWRTLFTDISDGIWMPLTWASYMLDYALWGDGNWGMFHLHSILLHGINAVLVFALLLKIVKLADHTPAELDAMNKSAWGAVWAALGAMLWAAHPLRVESVVWLASRKDVLSMMWLLLALLAWCGRRHTMHTENVETEIGSYTTGKARIHFEVGAGQLREINYWLSIGFFLIGAMAKPSVMCFPALCLLIDLCAARRVRVLGYVLPIGFAGCLALFAGHAQAVGGATELLADVPLWHRLLGACAAFGLYLWHTVWPADLAVQCVNRWPELPRFWLPGLAITGCVAWWLWRRWRTFGFDVAAWAWFTIAVFPMLGIATFGYHAFADRFTYIPAVGLSLGVTWGGVRAQFGNEESGRKGMLVDKKIVRPILCGLIVLVVAFTWASWRQVQFWRDEPTLFARTLEIDGDENGCAHGLLANWAFEFPHDLDFCVAEFEKAKATDAKQIENSYELFVEALCEQGDLERAHGEVEWLKERVAELEEATLQGKKVQSGRCHMLKGIHKAARVAYWVHDPSLRKAAAKELETNGGFPEDDAVWRYLRYRLSVVSNDVEGARKAKEALFAKSNLRGYNQFRFLKKDD